MLNGSAGEFSPRFCPAPPRSLPCLYKLSRYLNKKGNSHFLIDNLPKHVYSLNMKQENCELFPVQAETLQSVDLSDYKVYREIDRMKGLLRFVPNENGELIAKCAPDHYILPALKTHFTERFGDISWSIIDEKRSVCLRRKPGKQAEIIPFTPSNDEKPALPAENDQWEELWKHYHRTINNEDRSNPRCQKQFMPKRYWKYLPEV